MDFLVNVNINGYISVKLYGNKYNDKDIKINILDLNDNVIYIENFRLKNDFYYWYQNNGDFNLDGVHILIYHYDNVVYDRNFRFKDKHGNTIKPQALYINNFNGMGIGDHFSAEPIIRKLSKSFEQNITLFTKFPQLFINHPYINKVIEVDNYPKDYEKDYTIHKIFNFENDGIYKPKWASFDWKQKAATQLGFMLTPDEMEYKFYPNDYEIIEELPSDYVLINPSITGSDRNWDKEKWQKLIDILNYNNINVVSIGKKLSHNGKDMNYIDVNIEKGINLAGDERQDNLSQVWHLINMSKIFVTMDNGLFIFAGSTDTHILQLGSPINPYYHKPYRKGTQDYKYSYVQGPCDLYCFSELKYSILELGDIKESSIKNCYINKPYLCHPTSEDVANKILKILKNYSY